VPSSASAGDTRLHQRVAPASANAARRRGNAITVARYLAVLAARKREVVVTLLLVVGGVVAVSQIVGPAYESTATVRVASQAGEPVGFDANTYLDRLQNTYAKLATGRPLIDRLVARLGLVERPDVEVEPRPNTELLAIRVRADSPDVAARAANELAVLLIERARELNDERAAAADAAFRDRVRVLERELADRREELRDASSSSDPGTRSTAPRLEEEIAAREAALREQLRRHEVARLEREASAETLSLVERAARPTEAAGPNLKLALAIAVVLGLLGGVGIAFLFENLRPKLYEPGEIGELAEARVLGAVPQERRRDADPLFNSGSPAEEAFHRLRTHVLTLAGDRADDGTRAKRVRRPPGAVRRLLVTSAEPNEGKSMVVANLGVSIADVGRKVTLVDADLRMPSLHTAFGLTNELGLSSVLAGKAPLAAALQRTNVAGLRVLTSGPTVEHPADLLGSPELAEVLRELTTGVDVVLVDSPALLGPGETLALAKTIGNVVLVVRRTRTTREAVVAARSQLGELGVRIVGVVVNGAEAPTDRRFYGPRALPPAGGAV
jgi:succinoglycan biosynthesis transport protein ExoP